MVLSYPGGMTPEVLEVERALLALAPEERAAVIRHGLASLDDGVGGTSSEFHAEWQSEFRRRIDEIESGQVEMLTSEEVDAQVDALLAELRK